eukprot:9306886-Pyramimonas_sp.AAC.1
MGHMGDTRRESDEEDKADVQCLQGRCLSHLVHDRLEEALEASVIESIFQRHVHGVVLSST